MTQLQKSPLNQPSGLSPVPPAPPVAEPEPQQPAVQVAPAQVTVVHPHARNCDFCDAPVDSQQRYCLNCGARSRYVSNPGIDYLAGRRKPSGLPEGPTDNGIGGTGINKGALPWLVGSTLLALILGIFFGGALKGDNNEALLAALANRPAAAAATTGPTAAVASVALTSDFTLDKGFAVQVSTIPSTSDQAAADAAKTAATGKGATDVGLISTTEFTVDPDPGGNYVIYSGQFEKKADAEKALKKLKKDFPEAAVITVTKTGGGDLADALETDSGETSPLAVKVDKEKVAADKKAVEELDKKTGTDYVEGQEDLPDAVVIDDPNNVPGATGGTGK